MEQESGIEESKYIGIEEGLDGETDYEMTI